MPKSFAAPMSRFAFLTTVTPLSIAGISRDWKSTTRRSERLGSMVSVALPFGKMRDPLLYVGFHQVRRRCAEHPDAAGVEQ